MSTISCIIVDDEPLARKGLELHVKDVSWLNLLGQFPNAIQADDFLSKNKVDIVFLDIEMPGLNGLEYIRSKPINTHIILTTAYPQFAIEAFELDVVDYLLKPIRMERFFKAVSKVRDYSLSKKADIESISDDHFYIKADRKYIKLLFSEVLYIKGMKDYVMIFTETKKYMTALNIKTIFEQLPKSTFARISKSYLVNVQHISSIDLDGVMVGENELTLSTTYKEAFLNDHIKGKLFKR